MNRWMMFAVLVAAVPLVPLEALAQDTAIVKCELTNKYSLATIQNTNKDKKSAMCRWRCVYQIKPAGTFINQGANKLKYQQTKVIKKGAKNLQDVVGMAGSCG